VFALARIAVELLSGGEAPGAGSAVPAMLAARGVPAGGWDTWRRRALADDPAGRFPTVEALLHELLALCGTEAPMVRLAWEPPGSAPLEAVETDNTSDSETALSAGDARTTEIWGTPRPGADETLAADATRGPDDDGHRPAGNKT
jgi:hypothetical protein